jgi:hypothetical protein
VVGAGPVSAASSREEIGPAADSGSGEVSGQATGEVVGVQGNWIVIPNVVAAGAFSPDAPVFTSERPSAQLHREVDATRLAGVSTSPENPSGATQFRTDNNLLFRDDSRDPAVIFADGFAPREPSATDLLLFLEEEPSAFVSTTRDPNLNHLGPPGPGEPVYRYLIDAPGGVDVNATIGGQEFDHESEVVFPGGIRAANIVGAQEVLPRARVRMNTQTGLLEATPPTFGRFQPNPNFRPSQANPNSPTSSRPVLRHGGGASPLTAVSSSADTVHLPVAPAGSGVSESGPAGGGWKSPASSAPGLPDALGP